MAVSAAPPLLALDRKSPPQDDPYWRAAFINLVGEGFFFYEVNPVARMLLASRMMIAITGSLTLWRNWRWPCVRFGPKAGGLPWGSRSFLQRCSHMAA